MFKNTRLMLIVVAAIAANMCMPTHTMLSRVITLIRKPAQCSVKNDFSQFKRPILRQDTVFGLGLGTAIVGMFVVPYELCRFYGYAHTCYLADNQRSFDLKFFPESPF